VIGEIKWLNPVTGIVDENIAGLGGPPTQPAANADTESIEINMKYLLIVALPWLS
jgi:hypothetical protein